jgi:hypothetical protein
MTRYTKLVAAIIYAAENALARHTIAEAVGVAEAFIEPALGELVELGQIVKDPGAAVYSKAAGGQNFATSEFSDLLEGLKPANPPATPAEAEPSAAIAPPPAPGQRPTFMTIVERVADLQARVERVEARVEALAQVLAAFTDGGPRPTLEELHREAHAAMLAAAGDLPQAA